MINDPNSNTSNSCVQLAVDNTNPPWEGVCPAGSSSVLCGFGNNPACGQEACGSPLTTCADLSHINPNPYSQCGGTCNGTDYPSNHLIEVTRYDCTDGTNSYACLDLGAQAGQCGNTIPPPPPDFSSAARRE